MRSWRAWTAPALVLLTGLLLLVLVLGMPLDDGSYECPGNAIELFGDPLPEDNPPSDGFYAEPACNRAARERVGILLWIAVVTVAAAAGAFGLALARARRSE